MKTNPNDAAFSAAIDKNGNPTIGFGLTKREYFAAMAMQGFLANSFNDGVTQPISTATSSETAGMAVIMSDRLIEDLNR